MVAATDRDVFNHVHRMHQILTIRRQFCFDPSTAGRYAIAIPLQRLFHDLYTQFLSKRLFDRGDRNDLRLSQIVRCDHPSPEWRALGVLHLNRSNNRPSIGQIRREDVQREHHH